MAGLPGLAVTGAAGFIGAHLVRGFDARGSRVLPLVRSPTVQSPAGARPLEDALVDPALLSGVDVLVHAAAVRHRYGVDSTEYRASNVDLVERTMKACATAGVRRFVLVSSVGVYGFPADLPVSESHPYAPRTMYAATKVEAEMRTRRIARECGIELVIVRPTIVYGPGDRNGMLDKMAAMIRAGIYRIVGTGNNTLHHTHIDDIVDGVWLAATEAAAAGEDFILAGPETTTLAELSAQVARAVDRDLPGTHVPISVARALATAVDAMAHGGVAFTRREPPINHEKLDVMTLSVRFDTTKARRALGFTPHVSYEEGIARTLRGEWPAVAAAGAVS
ncbi:MAG TPA: NAD(P)-dependent oxidoreductase [Polyangiaceae bacterium]|nr:NAD(P)-dependent oxidoreductase [Polyangiaceae bacterium]